jgi:hypothetical protein
VRNRIPIGVFREISSGSISVAPHLSASCATIKRQESSFSNDSNSAGS